MKTTRITLPVIALVFMSCASYKAIVPGSTDHFSGASPSIVPGNVIRVTMKNGEIIEYLKVTSIDSEKILGIQRDRSTTGLSNQPNKVIMVPGIQLIEKRRISAGKTAGLITIVVLVPLAIFALDSYNNFSFGH